MAELFDKKAAAKKFRPQGMAAVRDYPADPAPVADDRVARALALRDALVPQPDLQPDPRLARAQAIEDRAMQPAPKPVGLGQTLGYGALQGLRAGGFKGGYQEMKLADEATASRARESQFEQAKALRAASQVDFGNTMAIDKSKIDRAKIVQDELAAQDTGTDRALGRDFQNKQLETTKSLRERELANEERKTSLLQSTDKGKSDKDLEFEDYRDNPQFQADRAKFGSGRAGFSNYQANRIDSRQQEAYDRAEKDRRFNQEHTLAGDFLKETDIDRQRLGSYSNLKSLGDDLKGADQIAVLYNFIRLMDPNRVSEGELVLAQQSQTIPEQWLTYAKKFTGTPNIFSPEGARRLRATADKMGGNIEKRVKETMGRYKTTATGFGLNPDNVVRGVETLFGEPQAQGVGGGELPGPLKALIDKYKVKN